MIGMVLRRHSEIARLGLGRWEGEWCYFLDR